MYNWRKLAISGALATTLTFSGFSVLAASFNDVSGSDSEISISKLVSLGYIANKGTYFHPESRLTRLEFAEISGRITTIGGSVKLKIKDLDTSKGRNKAAIRAVRGGLLSLNRKGEFKPKSPVTFAQLSKALAYGLGFKKTWSNRPLDYLYYLDRKGVLDIDTDLDAYVTREDVAVAVDKYMTVKQAYKTVTGVVSEQTATGIVVKTAIGETSYKFSANASVFQDEQITEKGSIGPGTPVSLTLNGKGQIAYVSSLSLSILDGTMAYDGSGPILLKGKVYQTDTNMVVSPLPSNPTGEFTYKEFTNYSPNGVSFSGTAFTNMNTDEVTLLSLYITKIEDRPINVNGNAVTFGFMDDFAFADLTVKLSDDAVIKKEDGTVLSLQALTALQSSIAADNAKLTDPTKAKKLTATAEAGSDGTLTTLTVKVVDPAVN